MDRFSSDIRDDLLNQLEEKIKELSEGKGRYNRDNYIHATNTIEDMKELSKECLKLIPKIRSA